MCNSFNKKFLDEAAKALDHDAGNTINDHDGFMDQAIDMAIKGVFTNEGGPFGCIIVKDGQIIGKGNNNINLAAKQGALGFSFVKSKDINEKLVFIKASWIRYVN